MTDSVEKVAEAIWNTDKHPHDPDWGRPLDDNVRSATLRLARDAYRASLEAIREPTKEQLEKGWLAHDGRLAPSYTAMIDALIKELENTIEND